MFVHFPVLADSLKETSRLAELKIAVRVDSIPGAAPSAHSLKKALAAASAMGASAVELCGRHLVPIGDLSDTGVRSLRKMLEDLNLRVAAIRFQTRRGYDHLDQLDRRVDATKLAMRAAYRLGSPLVVNQIGQVPEASAEPGSGVDGNQDVSPEQQRWNTMQSVLEDLGRFGAKVGAFLAAETGTESGERLTRLLDASDEAFVAVALNPGQLIINRHDVGDAVRSLANRIQLVCAVDGVLDLAAGRGLTVPLGQGIADFPNLIGRLEEIPYRGPYVVGRSGMDSETAIDELRQGVSYLQHL